MDVRYWTAIKAQSGFGGASGGVGGGCTIICVGDAGEILRDGGFVRKIFFGFAMAALVSGAGFGQVAAPAVAPLPSTVSAVSQGGAGRTMLLWPAGAPGALGDEDV